MFTHFLLHSVLLYTKVAEQAEVQEAVRNWLHCSANSGLSGYSSVAELYILHVLLPLGRTTEAKQLLMDDVGQAAFTEDQRQAAFTMLDDHEARTVNCSNPSPEPAPGEAEKNIMHQGNNINGVYFRAAILKIDFSYTYFKTDRRGHVKCANLFPKLNSSQLKVKHYDVVYFLMPSASRLFN